MLIASAWLEHHAATWAWDTLNELIDSDPVAAWQMIQLLVAYAPDYGTLAAVAAGPVEDLLSRDNAFEAMRREAEVNPRFRVCLQGAYGLPDDLQKHADKAVGTESLPPRTSPPAGSAEQIALMVSWFHHSDTHWAITVLEERIKREPENAWRVLRVLLRLADDLRERQHDVFLFGFDAFLRRHLATHITSIIDLARRHEDLRAWFLAAKRPPVDNLDLWKEFIDKLASA